MCILFAFFDSPPGPLFYTTLGVSLAESAQAGSQPLFINTVLLEGSLAHSYIYTVCLLSCYSCRVEEIQQKPYVWPTRLKIFTLWPSVDNVW